MGHVLLKILVWCLASLSVVSSVPQSGFYQSIAGRGVNGSGSEDFAAAWLVSKYRLLAAEEDIHKTFSMAAVSFAVVRNKCRNCHTVLTRDYFDYMVEHLSSTSNRIPSGDRSVYNITGERLKRTARRLKKMVRVGKDSRVNETLAVLIYSPLPFSMTITPEQLAIRLNYFETTFYSVHRYFHHVDIFVAYQEDADVINALGVPYRKLTIVPTPLDKNQRTTALMRLSLEMIMRAIHADDPTWSWLKYMYFTEGDQVLHLRNIKAVYDLIDSSDGTIAVVPHRMNTFPLRTTFPQSLQYLWDNPKFGQIHIKDVDLIVENLNRVQGSCCDAGRNIYEQCSGWWYSCPDWGLANFTQWIRVGKTGMTFLPSTEHKGVCTYSPERKLCPLPKGCTERVPQLDYRKIVDSKGRVSMSKDKMYDICGQIPTVNYIVNYTAQMEREREAMLSLQHEGGHLQLA